MEVAVEPVSRTAPRTIARPVLQMAWRWVSYLHWAMPPEVVAARLPRGLTPDLHDGRAYVGLVPFRMAGIRLGPGPGLPLPQGGFPETNVRTYVVGPDGGRGVYFHSLDISRAVPVAVARTTYRIPYALSRMRLERDRDRLAYLAVRRWPGPAEARSHVILEVGERLTAPTALDDFLSARWSLYTALPGGAIWRARVDHPPWPLRAATVRRCDDGFVAAAGYPTELGPPDHVHFGGDVEVRVDRPRRVG